MSYVIISPLIVSETGENLGNFPTGFYENKAYAQIALQDHCRIGFVQER